MIKVKGFFLSLLMPILFLASQATAGISNIQVDKTSTTITITWNTSGPERNDKLKWSIGTGCTVGNTASTSSTCGLTHSVTVSGLVASTTYCLQPGGFYCGDIPTEDLTGTTIKVKTSAATDATITSSPTSTISPTHTFTRTITKTATPSFTSTATRTPSFTATLTATRTPSSTATLTATPTATSTITKTVTPTSTITATSTRTPVVGYFGTVEYLYDFSVSGGTIGLITLNPISGTLPVGAVVWGDNMVYVETAPDSAAHTATLNIGISGNTNAFTSGATGAGIVSGSWTANRNNLGTAAVLIVDSGHTVVSASIAVQNLTAGKVHLILQYFVPLAN